MSKSTMHTFTITHQLEDGTELSGQFTCKKQSIIDHTKISRRKAELCGSMYCVRDDEGNPTGQGIDEFTESFNYAIAVLETALVQKPAWWNFNELWDQDLVGKVFAEVRKFEDSFRRRRGTESGDGQHSDSGQETSKTEPQATIAGSQPKKVVGGEVLAALDA